MEGAWGHGKGEWGLQTWPSLSWYSTWRADKAGSGTNGSKKSCSCDTHSGVCSCMHQPQLPVVEAAGPVSPLRCQHPKSKPMGQGLQLFLPWEVTGITREESPFCIAAVDTASTLPQPHPRHLLTPQLPSLALPTCSHISNVQCRGFRLSVSVCCEADKHQRTSSVSVR